MEYRVATIKDLEKIWDKNIKNHPDDNRWVRWKEEYINYNKNNEAITFVVVNNDDPIGEMTLVLKSTVKAVVDKEYLCDNNVVANMNAFRIEKAYEGKGYISKLHSVIVNHAKSLGIEKLTIGVEANETRNIAIYLHFGYNKYIGHEIDKDDGSLVLYYEKNI